MGNKKSKKTPTIYDKIQSLLLQTYKNTGIDFSENELVNFKLRILDSEKYFHTNFDYFIFFNNFLFKEQLAVLYDNFNQIIEKANKNPEKPLTILVDFDDESEYIMQGSKIEFDSLFTIIFEKLEIPTLIFFDMTNTDCEYVSDFFTQVTESVELYKYNRKFDCMYFLFPNTDYFLKNENSLVYMSNKDFKAKANFINFNSFNSDEMFEITNEFTDAVFLNSQIEKFINCSYPKNISNLKFLNFLKEIKPSYSKMLISFDLNCGFDSLESANADNFEKIKILLNTSEANSIVIFFNVNLDSGNLEFFESSVLRNFGFVMKKVVYLFATAKHNESLLGLKFNFKIKNEEEVNELNKLSSRTYNFNNINFYNNNNNHNNYASNSHREIKSARDSRSKRDKEKIYNYFYDSQTKNVFEFLTFELTSIINNLIDFPQLDSKIKAQEDKDSEQQYSNIIQSIYEYCSTNNNNSIINSNLNKNNKNSSSNRDNKNNEINNVIDKNGMNNKDKNNNNNKNSNSYMNGNLKNKGKNSSSRSVNDPANKKNKKAEKIRRKLNIEFNEITLFYKEIQEIVKYSTDANFDGGHAKIIKLDHNLHTEKLFLFWEKPLEKKEKEFKFIKQRNKEFNTLRNLINNYYKFGKLNEWNVLLNLQNMFLEDNIRKTYKIEKSNINLNDYLQKIH